MLQRKEMLGFNKAVIRRKMHIANIYSHNQAVQEEYSLKEQLFYEFWHYLAIC